MTRKFFCLVHGVALICALLWLATASFGASSDHAFLRAVSMALCATVYFIRMLATIFVFLRRPFGWPEALGLASLSAVLQLGAVWAGLRPPDLPFWALPVGLILYALGSALNSLSEWLRERFVASGQGNLYVGGPYAIVRHPNYLGDVLLFTGWALVVGQGWALLVPSAMAVLFVAVHIPRLEKHLRKTRGSEFRVWANRTWRLFPGIY